MAAQSGQLELNAFLPLIAHHLLGAMAILANVVTMFDELCVKGIAARPDRCRELLDGSMVAVTALVPHIGYEQATRVARTAYATGRPVREVIDELGLLDGPTLDAVLEPRALTRPGIAGGKPRQ